MDELDCMTFGYSLSFARERDMRDLNLQLHTLQQELLAAPRGQRASLRQHAADLDQQIATANRSRAAARADGILDAVQEIENTGDVILDSGSYAIKAGFAADVPHVMLPTVVGTASPSYPGDTPSSYIGSAAQELRGTRALTLCWPIQSGIVEDWETLEKLWEHTLQTVVKDTHANGLLLAERPLGRDRKSHRDAEAKVQRSFELFGVERLCIKPAAVLGCFSSGRCNGIVCDVGEALGHMTPVYEGAVLQHGVTTLGVGGADVTHQLGQLLIEAGSFMYAKEEADVVRRIMEQVAAVAPTPALDVPELQGQSVALPDGELVPVKPFQRVSCAEVLFSPHLGSGCADLVNQAIMACDPDCHAAFYSNILPIGGPTVVPGFSARLESQVRMLAPARHQGLVHVVLEGERARQIRAWQGGAIFANMEKSSTSHVWMHRDTYEEMGSSFLVRSADWH